MAYINNLRRSDQRRQRPQTEAIEAEAIPLEFGSDKFVQMNTSGSSDRQEQGKQSQNIRLDRGAFEQLVQLGRAHFESQ